MEKTKNTILIKCEVLKWARESIGFSLDFVSEKTKLSSEKIKEWENNDSDIKISDLKKLAKIYKRALSFFFLQKPPEISPIPNDFRTLDSVNLETLSADVRLAIRKAQRNRRFYAYLLEATETEQIKLPKISFDTDPSQLSTKLRDHLGIKIEDQKEWESENIALNTWIDAVEQRGVPVFQISLPKKEIRGFCLRENNLPPVIVINSGDAIRGRIFTLFHEFYHLLLSQTDIDSLTHKKGIEIAHKLIEMKANEFAGSFLIPNQEFLGNINTKRFIETKDDKFLFNLVKTYKVSAEVVYRRFVVHGYLSEREYEIKRAELKAKYEQEEIKKRKRMEESEKPYIPDYYRDVLKASSYGLSQKAFSAASEGRISTNDLVTFLDVKLSGIKKVQDKTGQHFSRQSVSTNKI